MPLPANRLMMSPRTVLPPPVMVKPFTATPAPAPFSWMSGVPLNPGCVQPSMMTASVIVGRAVSGVIVCVPVPTMLKLMRSSPRVALANVIASRNVPAPVSALLVTTNVVPTLSGATTVALLVLPSVA